MAGPRAERAFPFMTLEYSPRVSPGGGDRESRSHTEAVRDPQKALSPDTDLGSGRYVAIFEIGRQLLQQTDPETVLRTIHEAVVSHLHPDRAALLVRDGEGFRPLFTHVLDLAGPSTEWPLSWTVLRQVADSGVAVLASDARQDMQLSGAESIQRFRIRSVLCVPIGRPARGVLYLDNKSARPFTAADLEFLTAVALHASLVLERTYELANAAEALRSAGERLDALNAELLRHDIVGRAPALVQAYDAVRRFARSGARVLLRGETGTGKELFARAYAAHTPRAGGAYVPVTIPALAPTLVESELFGHVRGAFTEAARDKKGRLEVADGGVLFLDEVGDIDPAIQTKLLRFLDSGELYRVGDTQARRIDALVVSATNRPLERDVEQSRFRADLLARLGHVVAIPPLRERTGDVRLLVAHFLARHDRSRRKAFAPEAIERLERHHWPFNVRELQQVVERAVCLVDGDVIGLDDLPDYLRAPAAAGTAAGETGPPGPLKAVVEEVERRHILRALEFTGGNRRKAMELIQMSPEAFYRRLQEYGIAKKGAE
jgi:transcriptional regulator with GAF, ATPase, and Fis domain